MSGELISLSVAIMWTASALCFEYAGRSIKAVNLNLIRLLFAGVMIGVVLLIISGTPFPLGADLNTWKWMALSGFVGFVFGDYFLFSSYQFIHARFTQLIMTLAPLFAAVSGFFILGETMTYKAIIGMLVTISGIAMSIMKRGEKSGAATTDVLHSIHTELSLRGLFYALLASIGQGVGLVLSKKGMEFYNSSLLATDHSSLPALDNTLYIPLASTQIRILTGIICFLVIISLSRSFREFFNSFRQKKGILSAFGGSIVGPVIGVTLSLLAVQYTNTAVASTIMALTPVIILLPDRFIYKRKVNFIEVIGAIVSVVGVSLFFI